MAEKPAQDARQGQIHRHRNVLKILAYSLTLAIIAMVVAYLVI